LVESAPVPLATSFIYNPILTATEFLDMALADFDLPGAAAARNKAEKLFVFERFLLSAYREGKAVALIVDEAHKLSPEVLEEIRLFMNFETSEEKLLQIVLAGQPELNITLNRDDLQQVKQRVATHARTSVLNNQEVRGYVTFRWGRAGGTQPHPFSDAALDGIHKWSGGIPRMINGICDNALMSAFGAGSDLIGEREILEVVHDLGLRPPAPLVAVPPRLPAAPHFHPVARASASASGLITIPIRDVELDPPPSTSTFGRWAERLKMRLRREDEVSNE
jgi:general secretion pathway protein A